MATTYFADIPGNYIKGWLRDFDKATKEKKYQRIEYKIWRELDHLTTANKIKIEAEINSSNTFNKFTFYYPTTESKPYITLIPKENQFAQFISDWMGGVKDKNKSEILWHKDSDCQINNVKINCDDTITINTNFGTVHTISSDPCWDWNNLAICASVDTYNDKINEMVESLTKLNTAVFDSDGNIIFTEKENNNSMATTNNTLNNMFNFDFGPVDGDFIRMSVYGYAIRNTDNKYVSYDVEHNRMMDVQILNFNCAGIFYKVPKPLNKIVVGDVVFHNGVPMFVREVSEDHARFTVIDPEEGTEKSILPAHSPFGFDYLTTLISLMDGFDMPASEDNPFGNMLPLILMNNSKTSDQTLPLMLMMNGKMDMSNPLMLLALSDNNLNANNPLMIMGMMKMFDK